MITPAGPRVLIKPDPVETKVGSIIIAQDEKMAKYETVTGVVVAIGDLCWEGGEPWCKVGDHVYYTRHGGKYVKDGEEELLVLSDEDVIAVTRGPNG